jgi:hypothetical protein
LANVASSSKDTNAAPSKPIKERQKDDQNKEKQKDTKDSKPDKPDKNQREPKNKSEKQSKAAQPSDVQAAVAKGKSSGKGDKRDEKSPKGKKVKERDKKKLPCMYYACNSCNKGNECPYLHDSKNLYKGAKPRGLEKGTSSSAGAATVAAAAVVASQVQPCSGQDVSRTHAPHQAEGGKFGVNSSESEKQPRVVQPSEGEAFTKGVF